MEGRCDIDGITVYALSGNVWRSKCNVEETSVYLSENVWRGKCDVEGITVYALSENV